MDYLAKASEKAANEQYKAQKQRFFKRPRYLTDDEIIRVPINYHINITEKINPSDR